MSAAPADPTDIAPRGWPAVLTRTAGRFRGEHRTDWAAPLTCNAVLPLSRP